MKICYLADSESIHTKRWCEHFVDKGYDVSLISFKNSCTIKNVDFYYVDAGSVSVKGGNWKVLLKAGHIKKIIKKLNPDILHSHYATSYGIVGSLTNFHPFVITALGSDVLISPKKSIIYKLLLKYAFSKADWITTMAQHMNQSIRKIGNFMNKIEVVPFGIDTNLFNAKSRFLPPDKFIITSTRNFEDVYNLPHLIKAIEKIKDNIPNIELNLIGQGTKKNHLVQLVEDLGLSHITHFYGKVDQKKIVSVLNNSHIFVSVSLSDGNNISLNEAMACGCFPIVTNIDANIQWINNGENGFLVEINDVNQLSNLIIKTYNDYDNLSIKAFKINQEIVEEKANWNKNMKIVEDKYLELTNG